MQFWVLGITCFFLGIIFDSICYRIYYKQKNDAMVRELEELLHAAKADTAKILASQAKFVASQKNSL